MYKAFSVIKNVSNSHIKSVGYFIEHLEVTRKNLIKNIISIISDYES
ncbi:hypothetical protein VCHE25_1125 [Vibrio cholerae HE-25]|nr:hypothetical protein VCHE25_1125 [Vibrio cholerae HE-25]EMQ67108.1 hypothetical protein VCNHCC008D_001931 [Vibrio cholerae O1 str. NHCC-008D]